MAGCSSGSDDLDAAAATETENSLMVDTQEYELTQTFPMTMEVSSTVFSRIRRIPIEYTCTDNYWYPESGFAPRYGEDKSPPLSWANSPEGTQSFVLISDDPDAVNLNELASEKGITAPTVHWLIWNIPAAVTELDEHIATTTNVATIGPNTRQGINDFSQIGWSGPCPPPNVITIFQRDDYLKTKATQFPHGYLFKIYALDTELDLAAGANKNELLEAMDGHILAGGELRGEYINKKIYK
jgi:Raf kinase inhibitor-like YbhB/YbcL family protein